jgi:ATP-dependent Clp protease protease subunit
MNELLAQNTGKSIEQVEIDTERDNYMTAKEALEYGIIDKVIEKR